MIAVALYANLLTNVIQDNGYQQMEAPSTHLGAAMKINRVKPKRFYRSYA